ncbi:Putative calcium-dependent protein kinase [Klebsormidium nitens]|uniref:Putative calcium-dependent protein kinase n=1 Tax=Klebsormidium nitens TaxID=105231 RepID=A0A1Y1IFS6_KLENI|nr:Putative calcium-dependent protein kinase [Klebsormidium nitens]|eukprot:GAQ87616.1 Putative calcium-dependent protein kinase [Klebsormidium nitens]
MGNCFGEPAEVEAKDSWLDEKTKIGAGAHLRDDYKVLGGSIGYGRVATVRQGVEKRTGRKVAIKACSKKVLSTRPARISKVSEIHALQKIFEGHAHTNKVVELYATYEDAIYFYIVMELCSGGDLFQNLATRDVFLEQDAAYIIQQLLLAIQHCHAHRVVHRDLKPENILFVNDHSFDIKLVDFGSAAIVDDSTVLRDFMATPFYAAPEVWERHYGPECDIWSIGAILYVLVGGLPPALTRQTAHKNPTWVDLQAGKVTGLPEHISPELRDLLTQLVEPDPEKRVTASAALQHRWIRGEGQQNARNLEGSIRNIRAYQKIRQFQKAAVVLLSVTVDSDQMTLLANKIRQLKGSSGDLTELELEALVADVGLKEQASQLVALRVRMLGTDESDAFLSFDAADFLEILECRQLAAQQRRSRGRKGSGRRAAQTLDRIDELSVAGPRISFDESGDGRAHMSRLGSKGRSWHHLDTLGSLERIADGDEVEDEQSSSPIMLSRAKTSSPLAKVLKAGGEKLSPKKRKQKLDRLVTVHGPGLYAALMRSGEADGMRTHSSKE